MADQREFKIDLHNTGPDEVIDLIEPITVSSGQSRRSLPLLLALVALIAMAGILFFLYSNLNDKIRIINSKGSAGIANLSNDLNDKLSDFSANLSSWRETTLTMLTDLDTRLKGLSSSVSDISEKKLDKKEADNITKKIQNDISPLQTAVKKIDEQLTRMNIETASISENLQKIQTGVLNNKKQIDTLAAIGIDRDYFDKQLKKEREFNQQNMAHASEALFSEIATLHQLIKNLNNEIEKIKATSAPQQNSPGTTKDGTKEPSERILVPKPGEIIEQELN